MPRKHWEQQHISKFTERHLLNVVYCDLWNKQNSSTVAADTIKEMFGVYFKTPNITQWNSLFDSCNQITKAFATATSEGLEKMNSICDALAVPRFQLNEVNFLKEFIDVMTPLANALDLLQREKNMYMGYLLPIVHQTVLNLKEIQTTKDLLYCVPLINALIDGILFRFQSVWWKPALVVASCVHPKFKLDWIEQDKQEEACRMVIME